jgi:hypothetical protein
MNGVRLWIGSAAFAPLSLAAQPVLPTVPPAFTATIAADDPQLLGAGGFAIDSTGRIVLQDAYGNGFSGDRLLAVSPTGVVSVLAVPASAIFCTVSQVAIDGAGNAWVFSVNNNLLRVTPAGAVTVVPTGLAGGRQLLGLGRGRPRLPSRSDGALRGTAEHDVDRAHRPRRNRDAVRDVGRLRVPGRRGQRR